MANLNLIEAVRAYINRMIDACGPCMKSLVMDKETTAIVSIVYAQSEILQKEVVLFEMIDAVGQQTLKHLTAICFLRPTEDNIKALVRELHHPKYGNYYIYFTNFIQPQDIQTLADADDFECVRLIHEYYADYLAINPHLFTLNIPISHQKRDEWNDTLLYRTVQGLVAVLLSVRRSRIHVRYQNSSQMAQTLAECLRNILSGKLEFDRSKNSDNYQTTVLILDRRADPVTPLLNQWTYQAMVHELISIKNNRVNLSKVPGITKDLEEVVLNAEYDEFYANNLYSNFGEIATNIKILMEHYQETHKNQSKIESINDMKAFVESYPQFKKLSGTVSKHVTIISELSRLVGVYQLLEVSETEQNLVCQGNHNEMIQKIKQLIHDEKVRNEDILRILCLYALRYERQNNNELATLKIEAQKTRRFPDKYIQFIQALLDYSAQKYRQTELFNSQSPIATTRQLFRGLRGVDNVYAQHVPLIKDLLEQLLRGKLKDTLYPIVTEKDSTLGNSHSTTTQSNQFQQQGQVNKPSEIIVYIIGGVTYEESNHIQMMNKQGARIILGASYIHNFSSFIDEVFAGTSLSSSSSTTLNDVLSTRRR